MLIPTAPVVRGALNTPTGAAVPTRKDTHCRLQADGWARWISPQNQPAERTARRAR